MIKILKTKSGVTKFQVLIEIAATSQCKTERNRCKDWNNSPGSF